MKRVIKVVIKMIFKFVMYILQNQARIASAIMREVYVPRVNHFGVISRPLALTDITAIDCDLLPNDVQLQSFGHRRLLALQGHKANYVYQCRVTAAGTYWPCKGNMLANARVRN